MTSFYDDFCQLEVQELADSAQATAQVVLRLLGWRVAEEPKKCMPFAQVFDMLGASFSLTRTPAGILEISNKEGRLQALHSLVNKVCADGFVHPAVLASLKGRLLYASTHTFGRVALMAVSCCHASWALGASASFLRKTVLCCNIRWNSWKAFDPAKSRPGPWILRF